MAAGTLMAPSLSRRRKKDFGATAKGNVTMCDKYGSIRRCRIGFEYG
jgi:hypothetical protein